MKRLFPLLVLALSLSLLSACGHMELTYKTAPAASATGSAESPMSEPSPKAEVSPVAPESAPETPAEAPSPDDAAQIPPDVPTPDSQAGMPAEAGGTAAPAAAETSPAPDIGASQKPEPAPVSNNQPPLLTEAVSSAGFSFGDFSFSQLVLVAAEGSKADIYCYDKGNNGLWALNENIGYAGGYIGRNGVSTDKHEGDGCSPSGLFSLGFVFGNKPKPTTAMDYRAITQETYWIDDPDSAYYNQWVEGTDGADWTGGEHLSDNTVSYAYAVVIDYNTAPNTVAGKGSAIFMHIGNKPTSGCVAVSEETLLKILRWLAPEKSPSILIAVK